MALDDTVVGIDVGGTFTDFVVLKDRQVKVHKTPSTPSDPSLAILRGILDLGVEGAAFVHGSTVATNAILERKGARTVLITTEGFEDVLEIGRQNRKDIYDLMMDRPEPLIPADLRYGLHERIDYTGRALVSPTDEDLASIVETVRDSGAESVAVSLLFSFLNPLHENMVMEALAGLDSRPFLSVSSQVLPEFREYERTSSVAINAYVGPAMSGYLGNLEASLGSSLRVMQSSGGSITCSLASHQPVRTILSGPAGGVVGAFHVGSQAGYKDLITIDMGGTSTDVSLCPGRIKETTASEVAGCPVSVPMIEIHTVGAGGGSIARLDPGGALTVGPESAGADPGPACYGKGNDVTVTDANLVLGRLQPDHFLGGSLPLDRSRSLALMEGLAHSMSTTVEAAALGIIRVVNSSMERAIRTISMERGYDPRDFTLLAFGGAGPMHSCELAQELGIPRVLVPLNPGVLSALGAGIADIVKDYSRTVMLRGPDLTTERMEEGFSQLLEAAYDEMAGEGLDLEKAVPKRSLDVRYVGQSYELNVDFPKGGAGLPKAIATAFHRAHRQRFGYSDANEPVEAVNLRLKMSLPVEPPKAAPRAESGESPVRAKLEDVDAVFAEGTVSTGVFRRDLLETGNLVQGPALVVQFDSTTVMPPGWSARVDSWGNLILTPTNIQSHAV